MSVANKGIGKLSLQAVICLFAHFESWLRAFTVICEVIYNESDNTLYKVQRNAGGGGILNPSLQGGRGQVICVLPHTRYMPCGHSIYAYGVRYIANAIRYVLRTLWMWLGRSEK